MTEFAVAFLRWLLIFTSSAIVASITSRKNPKKAVYTMQLTMLFLSLAVIELTGSPKRFGFAPDFRYIIPASILGFGTSLTLNLIEGNLSTPGFLPERTIPRLLLLLLLAPLSEETLNRALVEGYLLGYGHLWSAILFSTLLFALPHWMAFETTEKKAFAVSGALTIGLSAGYFFALGGIIPAFLLHSSANLAGLPFQKLVKGP